jgi:putative hydrolase of the HAD superfamily
VKNESTIKGVLFDLGGVLLQLRDPSELFELGVDNSDFLERWIRAEAVREFESGNATFEQFASRIVIEAALPYGEEEFLKRFHAWPLRLYPDVTGLLDRLSEQYLCAVLSNTNAVHWGRKDIAGVLQSRFDKLFLSYETGILKPDREAFDQVVEHYGCAPGEILFIDDTPSNVTAARNLGICAHLASGAGRVERLVSEQRLV